MSKVKKYSIVLGMMLVLGVHISCYATDFGVITGQTVKLREKPTTESKSISLLDLDDKIEILGKEGNWYQIKFEGKTGYVSASYVKTNAKLEENTTNNMVNTIIDTNNSMNTNVGENEVSNEVQENQNTPIEENQQENIINQEITVPSEQEIKEDIQVRIIPLINASSIGELKKGSKVTVTEKINDWAYVVSEEFSGWVYVNAIGHVKIENSATKIPEKDNVVEEKQESKENTVQNKVGYVNVDSVNIRKSPDTTSEIIDALSKNAEVTIVGEENNWYQIKTATEEGYIAKKYISDTKVEITNRSSDFERKEKVEVKQSDEEVVTTVQTGSGEKVVSYAKQYLGSKYVSGGNGPTSFDCSGFTRYVYQNFGYSLARTAAGQSSSGRAVNKSELQLGDLVFFSQGTKSIGHVGIYVGGNSFIHAANARKGVIITSLSDSYYIKNYVTARRIL